MAIFNISTAQFGFAVSAYSITAGFSGLISAFYADRFDRKTILLFAYIGFVLGTIGCGLATSFPLLITARIGAGFFGGIIGAQVLSILADAIPFERRAQALSYVMLAFSAASVAGVPCGLWLASNLGWQAPFLGIGMLGGIIACLIYHYIPSFDSHINPNSEKQNPWKVWSDIQSSPNQKKALTLSAVLMLGHFAIIPYIAPVLVGNAGFDNQKLYQIYLVGGSLTIFSAPLIGKLADKKGKLPVFTLFAALSLIPVGLITHIKPMPTLFILMVAGLFFIITNGRMIPVQAMVSAVVPPDRRGGFMGINSAVQQFASGVAANLAGWVITKNSDHTINNYPLVGYFSMAMIVCSMLLAHRLDKNSIY